MNDLAEVISQATGVRLSASQLSDLRQNLENMGLGPERWRSALGTVLNAHSHFWRHPQQFEFLARAWACDRIGTQVWSAGCSTGAETYSLAIALREAGRDGLILGTDLVERNIETARSGVYPLSALRGLPAALAERYLEADSKLARVQPQLRSLVNFEVENLLAPKPRPGFDVILCRNVLIYFETSAARRVINLLVDALETGGYLVLGYPEATLLAHPDLVSLPDLAIYRKQPGFTLPTPLPPTRPGRDSFDAAVAAHSNGELELAEQLLSDYLRGEPEMLVGHFLHGRLLLEMGRPDEARGHLNRLLTEDLTPDQHTNQILQAQNSTWQQLRGAAALALRRLDEARG